MSAPLPPHNIEAEQFVLGCCLLDPGFSVGRCVEALKPESFFDIRHSTIFQAIAGMYDENIGLDVATLMIRMRDAQMLEQIGGLQYIAGLPDVVPSAQNVDEYIRSVADKYTLRRLLDACRQSVEDIQRNGASAAELLDAAERRVMSVRADEFAGMMTPKELVAAALARIEESWKHGGLVGLATGFPDYDRMTGGLKRGEFVIVSGKTSSGKTALVMNMVEHVLLSLGKPVGVFNMEMDAVSLVARAIGSHGRVNLRERNLTERDFDGIRRAATRLASADMNFCDDCHLTLQQFRAKARRMRHEQKVELIVVDYLQLLSPGAVSEESRQQEVAELSKAMKRTARELGIPLVVLSQVNDDGKIRESRAPTFDADTVCRIDWEAGEDEDGDGEGELPEAIPVLLRIKKQRNGPRGTVRLTYLTRLTRFESAARVQDDDVPGRDQR